MGSTVAFDRPDGQWRDAFLYGSVLMWFDVNQKKATGVISGPGKLWFGPSTDRTVEGSTSGTIRLKIVHIDGG